MSDTTSETVSPVPAIAASVSGEDNSVASTAKTIVVAICTLGIVYIEHGSWKHALGVLALLGSPRPLRAMIAPFLARALKSVAKEIA